MFTENKTDIHQATFDSFSLFLNVGNFVSVGFHGQKTFDRITLNISVSPTKVTQITAHTNIFYHPPTFQEMFCDSTKAK